MSFEGKPRRDRCETRATAVEAASLARLTRSFERTWRGKKSNRENERRRPLTASLSPEMRHLVNLSLAVIDSAPLSPPSSQPSNAFDPRHPARGLPLTLTWSHTSCRHPAGGFQWLDPGAGCSWQLTRTRSASALSDADSTPRVIRVSRLTSIFVSVGKLTSVRLRGLPLHCEMSSCSLSLSSPSSPSPLHLISATSLSGCWTYSLREGEASRA